MLPFAVLLCISTASLFATESRTLTVFVDNPSVYSSIASSTMRSEIARIVSPLSLQLNWRQLSAHALGEDFDQIVVVRLRGSCAAGLPPAEPSKGEVRRLASAAVSNGSILPFATIECDNLKRTIAASLHGQREELQEERLGRAMARVLAHELYHILGTTKFHQESGIAKACFGPKDLLAEHFSLDEATLAQMRLPPVEESANDLADSSGR